MVTVLLFIAVACAGIYLGSLMQSHPAETQAALARARDWLAKMVAKLKGRAE